MFEENNQQLKFSEFLFLIILIIFVIFNNNKLYLPYSFKISHIRNL